MAYSKTTFACIAAGFGARYIEMEVDFENSSVNVTRTINYPPYRDLQATKTLLDENRKFFLVVAKT